MEYGTLVLVFSLFLFYCTALSNDDMSYISPDSYDYSDDSISTPATQKPIVRNPGRVKINYHKTTMSPAISAPDNSNNQDIPNPSNNPSSLDMQISSNMNNPIVASDKYHRIKILPTSSTPDYSNNQDMLNLSDQPNSFNMQSSPNMINFKHASSTWNNSNARSTLKPFGRSNSEDIFITPVLSIPDSPYSETTPSTVSTRPVIIRSKVRRRRTTTTSPKDYSSTESKIESDYPLVGDGQTSPATTPKPLPMTGQRRKLRITTKPTSKTTISTEATTNYVENINPNESNNLLNVETAPKIIPNKGVRFINQGTTVGKTTPSLEPLNVDYTENDITNNQSDMPPTTTPKTTLRSRSRPTTTSKANKFTKITTTKSTSTNKLRTTGEPSNDEAQLVDINPTTASQYNPINEGLNSEELKEKLSTSHTSKSKPTYMPPKARSKSSSSVSSSSTSKTFGRFNKKTTGVNSLHINPTASSAFEDELNSSKMISTHTYSRYTKKVTSSMSSSTSRKTYSRYTKPTTLKSTSANSHNAKYTRSFSSTILPDVIVPSMPLFEDTMNSHASIVLVDDYLIDSVPTTQTLKDNGEIVDPASIPISTDYDL